MSNYFLFLAVSPRNPFMPGEKDYSLFQSLAYVDIMLLSQHFARLLRARASKLRHDDALTPSPPPPPPPPPATLSALCCF